jgi:DNA-binding NarL/FixJ family response regulator
MSSPIRILLIDSCRFFRDALWVALSGQDRTVLMGAATDPDEAIALMEESAVNVVLVSADRYQGKATSVVQKIKERSRPPEVIVLGVDDCEERILSLIEAGADGYTLKNSSLAEVLATIEAVHEGRAVCSPRVMAAVFTRLRRLSQCDHQGPTGHAAKLSRREQEILALIAQGLVNKEIAWKLGITLCTVKNHVHNILDKLGVNHRREAVRLGRAQETFPDQPRHSRANAAIFPQ